MPEPYYDDDGIPTWELRSAFDVDRCEDCGISIDRHGESCGFEIGDTRAPEYGRPAGWLTGDGKLIPLGDTEA
jgi:hypothetical protein